MINKIKPSRSDVHSLNPQSSILNPFQDLKENAQSSTYSIQHRTKILVFLLTFLFWVNSYAVCPICVVAVGAGVGLSRWFGIDDVITGVWLGGLTVSVILWTLFWLDKKSIRFTGRNFMISVGYYFFVLFPLKRGKIIGHPANTLWGFDKLMLGIIVGSILFALCSGLYFYLKKRNNNRAYFPFQKVVMPLAPLMIASIIFYFIARG